MKKLCCGDAVPGCEAGWMCPDEDELLAQETPELPPAVRVHLHTAE